MHYARAFTVAIVAAAASLLWRPAAAEDFTFNVRVELSNLSSAIDHYGIRCAACTERCQNTNPGSAAAPWFIGNGTARHTFPPGAPRNFNGVIRVAFDARPGRVPELARNYLCQGSPEWPPGYSDAVHGPRPGTPYVDRLEGTIGGATIAPPAPLTADPKGALKGGTFPKGTPGLPKR